MVILEHGAVGQIEAVVFPAADGDGVFLQGAQPRQGFAGVGDNSPRSPNLLHRFGGGRRNARHMLQKVERRAFPLEKCTGMSLHSGDEVARTHVRSLRQIHLRLKGVV